MSDKLANPGPLGLMGFGMTTVLLNIHNAGFFPEVDAMIMAMGLFYGGAAQVIAGILEFKKGNTFGLTAFTSYGFFWIALVGIWVLPNMGLNIKPVPAEFMGCFLAMWGIFTLYMFVATLKANKALQVIFGTLTILFFLLALADFTHIHAIKTFAGYEGLVCGFSAIYLAMAEVLNEKYGRIVIPIG